MTPESATASKDNDRSQSAGTPAEAVAGDKVTDNVKSLLPIGAFRTDDHRYYFNGDGPVPGVTSILELLDKPALGTWKAQQAAGALYRAFKTAAPVDGHFIGMKDEAEAVKWALSEVRRNRDGAASIGTGVHHLADMFSRASESDSKGFQVGEATQPYLDAFRAFSDRYSRSSFVSSEKMVWSLNGYAGTYDLLVMIMGELWLLDIKTGKGLYPEFGLQLAAYRWSDWIILEKNPTPYPMPKVDRTGVLHLRPDQYSEGYMLYEYPTTYESDYMTFLGILEVSKWKQQQRKPIQIQHGNLVQKP